MMENVNHELRRQPLLNFPKKRLYDHFAEENVYTGKFLARRSLTKNRIKINFKFCYSVSTGKIEGTGDEVFWNSRSISIRVTAILKILVVTFRGFITFIPKLSHWIVFRSKRS